MKSALLLCAFVSGMFPAAAAPRLFVTPRADSNPANPGSGRVVARLQSGRFVRLSRTARCWNPKPSPDGASWAWIEGETVRLDNESQTLFPAHIVVWRNRASRLVRGTLIRPEKIYEVGYRWADAGHLAVASRGRHGPTHLQLFDARTGLCVAHRHGYDVSLPFWARAIADL